MCGIAGMVGATIGAPELQALLERMGRALEHRGPDDFGLLADASWGGGLACCRLAISDPAGGRQPMENEDSTVAVVCNGEIYNHRELRAGLLARGHRFRSACDTEVIVHLYEEMGPRFVEALEGMFAIAVLDRRRRTAVLARDRMGMKPLYYARTAGGICFGSEIKALFASGLVTAKPDRAAIDTYLAVGYVPAPRTCFTGVEKLPAGEIRLLRDGEIESHTYWRLEYAAPSRPASDQELAAELDGLLDLAVRDHLAADVPVGVLASGGWDSSLVAFYAARASSRPPPLFTIVQPESPELDEGPPARLLARTLGAEHHEIEFRWRDIPALVPAVVRHLDVPCMAAPALLQYQLASLAAGTVKAVVGGEGSDELFAGYPVFGGAWRYGLRRLLPRAPFREPARRVTQLQWGRMLRTLAAPDDGAADREQYRLLTDLEKRSILGWELADPPDLEPLRLDPRTEASCRDPLQRKMAIEITRRLPDGLLMVNDRMSMAHALEIRMPFLDGRVVDFARRLPSRLKRRGGQEKFILSLLVDRLPPAIARRKKFGLRSAMDRDLAGPLRGWVRELLLDAPDGEPFRRRALEPLLERWLDDHRRDRFMRRPMCLILLQAWWNEFF
jgi:asparagine synthase (glutamine-hydrolysing)